MTRQEELTKAGWEKKSVADEPRLSEIAEMYKEIGFEVHLESFNPDEEPGCIDCMKKSPETYKVVYTRKKP